MYRKYINIIEAANKGCPIATHDLDVNVKNRQTAIDKHHYGPANPDEPGSYANCAAFNITDAMYKCMEEGMGKEAYEAEKTREAADLGYCNLLHFKCAGTRSCQLWITGGPIVK